MAKVKSVEEILQKTVDELLERIDTEKEEVKQVLKELVRFASETKKLNAETAKRLEGFAEKLVQKTSREQLKQVQQLIKEGEQRLERRAKQIKDGYTPIKGIDYFDGENPDVDEVVVQVLDRILESLDDGEEIIRKINEDESEARISRDKIEGLDEMEKRIIGRIPAGGSPGARQLFETYDLSSSLNGSTKTFNIPANWTVLDVRSSSFPFAFRYGVDYTFTPTTITFTDEVDAASTLATGQTIYILYVVG